MEAAPEAGSPPAAAGAEVPAAWAAATDDGPAAAAEGAQADVLVVKRGGPSEADGLPAPEWEDEQGGGDGGDGGDGEGGGAADAAADALAALQLKSGAAATEAGSPGGSPGIKAHRGRASLPAAQPSSTSATSGGSSKRRTFTAPPKCLSSLPRPVQRANYSHSPQRVRQILRDNERLVKRLSAVAVQRPAHEESQQQHDLMLSNVAASSAARRRAEAGRVMKQNLRIYARLQAIKPSRDVARAAHERDFARHERQLATLAALRRRTTGGKGKQGKQGGSKRQTASAAAAAEPAPREAGQEPRSPAQEVAAA